MKNIVKKIKLTNDELESQRNKIKNFNDILNVLKQYGNNFDESIDLSIRINPKKKNDKTIIRGNISLPHSTIKNKPKIAVFASGEDIEKALKAGATRAGLDDLVEEVKNGTTKYDYYVATKAVFMQISGKVAKTLKTLTPSLKSGTVTEDVTATCTRLLNGILEYREKDLLIHGKIGYKSFDNKAIQENGRNFLQHLYNIYNNNKSIVEFFKSITISCTQTPGIQLDNSIILELIK